MADTARMSIPYPERGENPFFDTFESMVQALDAHDFAAFEDRNLFVVDGGNWSWSLASGTLTWGSTLRITTPSTGLLQSLAAGSVTLDDGEMLVVDVSRGAASAVTLSASVVSVLDPPTDSALVIAIRSGSKVYFRNGRVITDGSTLAIFEGEVGSGGGGGGGTDHRDYFTGDGATTAFVLSSVPDAACIPMVFLQGVLLEEGMGADYTIAGANLTFTVAPALAQRVQVRYWT